MNRLDPAIANAKRLCGLSGEKLPPMSMARYIVELQEGMQTLLKELDDALVIANERGYGIGYDEGYSKGNEDGYSRGKDDGYSEGGTGTEKTENSLDFEKKTRIIGP